MYKLSLEGKHIVTMAANDNQPYYQAIAFITRDLKDNGSIQVTEHSNS
jgi:hypothetical protein